MATITVTQPTTSAFLTAGWHHLAMLNFRIDPEVLAPFVPAGTELDFWDEETFVSIVGFQFLNTKVFGMSIPFHLAFEEVNLRFYVRRLAPDGWRRGVVFLREIAPRTLVSLVARWVYNENYATMPMRHRVSLPAAAAGIAEYEWFHGGRWHTAAVRMEGSLQRPSVDSLEEHITEHYWGYTKQRDGATIEYQVEHPPWRVWSAASARFDCDVEAIYGKPFVPFLRTPTSAFVADGSPVVVRRGVRL